MTKKFIVVMMMFAIFCGQSFADYKARSDFSLGDDFRTQVRYGMQSAAIDILAETPDTAYHRQRCEFAVRIMNGQYGIDSVSLAITTNWIVGPKIDAGEPVTDADVSGAIAGIWNHWAGVITE